MLAPRSQRPGAIEKPWYRVVWEEGGLGQIRGWLNVEGVWQRKGRAKSREFSKNRALDWER